MAPFDCCEDEARVIIAVGGVTIVVDTATRTGLELITQPEGVAMETYAAVAPVVASAVNSPDWSTQIDLLPAFSMACHMIGHFCGVFVEIGITMESCAVAPTSVLLTVL